MDPTLRPTLWWNADSFDLLSFVPSDGGVSIRCSLVKYFTMVDVSEAVGHELVAAHLSSRSTSRLRFRREIGDPFDLSSRPFVPAIPTLVLFKNPDGPPTFLLHDRDIPALASAGGTKHVFGGQFQPSSRHSIEPASDADLWRSVAREIAEEMLGAGDVDGSAAAPLSLESGPLAELEALRGEGHLDAWLLGLGLDPLTLWPDLLATVVMDEVAVERTFGELPSRNPEGVIVGSRMSGKKVIGFPFDEPTVAHITALPELHPAAAACIRLAWRHRRVILSE